MTRNFGCAAAGLLALALAPPAAHAATGQPPPGWEHAGPDEAAGILVAANKTYKFVNIFPFAVQLRIYGIGPDFPQVVLVPAAPGPPVPVPYPGNLMPVKFKKPNGAWSSTYKIPWKSGNISLPNF